MKSSNNNRHVFLRITFLATALAFLFGMTSCSHESTRQLSPGFSANGITGMRSFYVRKHSDDDYELGEDIVSELQLMGYRATTGSAESPPGRVDGVITYTDKWMWDISMYLLSLDVQLQEPASDAALASAKTIRTSLVRKSQKEMVRETLSKLFEES